MSDSVEIVTVNAGNVDEHGFFCYKSKPGSPGYLNKLSWLRQRFGEGLVMKIVYENGRSVGYIEYIPGEHAWRTVEAPGYLVIHCIWVVGRGKKKGYGSKLLTECIDDAVRQGRQGVVMVSSSGNWLANSKLFLKHGFEELEKAPPSFSLLVKKTVDGPEPVFPGDWEQRLARFSSGATILYTDQCPYMPDAVQGALDAFAARGIPARPVKFETGADVREKSPAPYGVFGVVYNGKLLSHCYLGPKELKNLDQVLRT